MTPKNQRRLEDLIDILDLKNDVKVDKYKLDVESQQHSSMFADWSEALGLAKQSLEDCDLSLLLAKANAEKQLREDMASGKKSKYSETTVKVLIDVEPSVIEAYQKQTEAKKVVIWLNAGVVAMEHRKFSIAKLVDLYIHKYYSAPHNKPNFKGREESEDSIDRLNREREEKFDE